MELSAPSGWYAAAQAQGAAAGVTMCSSSAPQSGLLQSSASTTIEVVLVLGSTFDETSRIESTASDPVLNTSTFTRPNGLLATASLLLGIGVTFQDVSNAAPATTWAQASSSSHNVVVELAAMAVLESPGTSAPYHLRLYTCIDLQTDMGLTAAAPSPLRPDHTRFIATKSLQFARLIHTSTPLVPSLTLADGRTVDCRDSVMLYVGADTACLPPSPPASCGPTDYSVFANSALTGGQTYCSGNFGAQTPCEAVYHANGPMRLLLQVQMVPAPDAADGAADLVAYLQAAGANGVRVPATTPCFPHLNCGSAPLKGGPVMPNSLSWPVIGVVVFLILICVAVVLAVAHHVTQVRHHLAHTTPGALTRTAPPAGGRGGIAGTPSRTRWPR